MADVDRVIRGIPAWLMGEYLQELGGVAQGNGRFTGPDWVAHVTQIEDFHLGSLHIGQIHFVLQGTDAATTALQKKLEVKLLRGGG
ncbi:MAG: DUF1952 domain-containing protein [Chloroflexota bacterium]|nr:DUF1952 domain-containing protein [Ardenticatenaceae bacterium]